MYYSGIDLHKDMSVITTINENGVILSQSKVPNHEAPIITYFNQVSPLGAEHKAVVESTESMLQNQAKSERNTNQSTFENELNIVKITAGTLASNTGMLKLIKESGMLLESIKKNHEIVDNISVDVLYFSKFKS